MDTALDFETIRTIIENNAGKVDSLIDSYLEKKEQLISLLQDIQAEFNYIPQDVLIKISQKLDIPLSQVFSVATFFQAFSLRPRGRHTITVCLGTACHVKGGQRLVDKMERDFGLKPGETTEDERFTLETANCLGCCALGPVVVVDGKYESQVNPEKLDKILKKYE
ncbi:MAG TPA: NADH-quinone oxidoreductase subunit NuoE [Dehalococcoidales bacterium]|nr:NADH-quinone oxidoreductase subunit NuoE [Dehalococcoidales bacterium]